MPRVDLPRAFALCGLLALAVPRTALTAPCDSQPRLHPGAIEIGVAGSATEAEGVKQGEIGVRVGEFFAVRSVVLVGTLEPSFIHVAGLDHFDVEGSLSWQHRASCSPVYGFVAGAAGVRQEWIGSFREARYPVGFGVGLCVLASSTAGLRIEYRYRRVLHDPVGDLSEHRLLVGLSVFLRNRSSPPIKSPE